MSKVIIEFDSSSIDDKLEMERFLRSTDMASVLFEISTNLKKRCTRIAESQEVDSNITDGVYIVFQQIQELFEEYSINIDKLIQ